MKTFKKITIGILGFIIMCSPYAVTHAAGILPDCGIFDSASKTMPRPCDFNALLELVNKIINFLLFTLATPLVALILTYAGWLYITSGGSDENTKKAKSMMKNAVWGYILALSAWLIINTLLKAVGFKGPTFLS
ncbi:MAG: hypothetical protein KBB75_00880 [Candidatus Pacebacteria bacterium]|jgi:hypothetical protein|nr:hypothetical protein [Candidatus Paceibacterota bacterium]